MLPLRLASVWVLRCAVPARVATVRSLAVVRLVDGRLVACTGWVATPAPFAFWVVGVLSRLGGGGEKKAAGRREEKRRVCV